MTDNTKFMKPNGFPTPYGYACGYVKTISRMGNSLTISQDGSGNVMDVKGFINDSYVWQQFFHCDYHNAIGAAEKFMKKAISRGADYITRVNAY